MVKKVTDINLFLQLKTHLNLYYNIMVQRPKDFKMSFMYDGVKEIQLAIFRVKDAYLSKDNEHKIIYLKEVMLHLTNLELLYEMMIGCKDFNEKLSARLLESLSKSIIQCSNWLTKLETKI